jgi:hypothetical protein
LIAWVFTVVGLASIQEGWFEVDNCEFGTQKVSCLGVSVGKLKQYNSEIAKAGNVALAFVALSFVVCTFVEYVYISVDVFYPIDGLYFLASCFFAAEAWRDHLRQNSTNLTFAPKHNIFVPKEAKKK